MLENKDQANFAPENVEEKLREWTEDKSRVKMIEECFNFKLFPQQKELLCAMSENREVICKKPRNTGGTTVVAAYVACNMVLANDIPEIVLWVDTNEALVHDGVARVKGFILQIPKWVGNRRKNGFITDNKRCLMLGNRSKIVGVNPNVKEFERTLLDNGINEKNLTHLVFDNAAFNDNIDKIMMRFGNFEKNILMMSTPNHKDKMFHQIWGKAMLGLNNYEMVSFKWYKDPRFSKDLKWVRVDKDTCKEETHEEPWLKDCDMDHNSDIYRDLMKLWGWSPINKWYIDKTKVYDKKSMVEEIDGNFYNVWVEIASAEPQNGPDEADEVQPPTEEELRRDTINRLSRDYEGTVIDSKEFFKIFPETKSWFAPMIRYQNFDSLLRFVKVRSVHFNPWDFSVIKEGSDFFYKVYFYTDNNEYCIHFQAVKNAPEDVYIAGYSKSRRTYPGETWTRGSDLPDGDYSYKTFCKIKDAIISSELKTLHFKMK